MAKDKVHLDDEEDLYDKGKTTRTHRKVGNQLVKRVAKSTSPSLTKGMVGGNGDVSLQLLEMALRQAKGLPSVAANVLSGYLERNIRPSTVRKLIKRYPVLSAVCAEAQSDLYEIACENVAQGIHDGDKTYTMFYIKECADRSDPVDLREGEFFNAAGQIEHVLDDVDYSVYDDNELANLKVLATKAQKAAEGDG